MSKMEALKKILGQDVGSLGMLGGSAAAVGGAGWGLKNLLDEDNTAGESAAAGGLYGGAAGLNNAAMNAGMKRVGIGALGASSRKAALIQALLGAGIGAGLGSFGGDE